MDTDQYAAEAEERWGHSAAYQESAARTARHTEADWEQLKAEADEINRGLLALMVKGESASGEAAMSLAERHRAHISQWFYDCPVEIHAALGEMYVADSRFSENIDKAGPGLAAYLSAAIAANAAMR